MSYDSAVLADNPFHFWKLNGSLADSGTLADALTGTTPNSSGGPLQASDGYDPLSGANTPVETNSEQPFIGTAQTVSTENPFGGSYTVVMGLKVPSGMGAHANGYVMTPHDSIPPGALWIDGTGALNVAGWGTGYTPPGGSWVHIAYTWDGTTLRLYVNGSLNGSHVGQNAGFGAQAIRFGMDNNGGNVMPGSVAVSRVAVFTSALSSGNISTLYTDWNAGVASTYDTAVAGFSPVNYWKFNGSASDSGSLANNVSWPGSRPFCSLGGPFGDGFESIGATREYSADFWVNPSATGITGYLFANWNAQPAGSVYLTGTQLSTWGGGSTGYYPPANAWTHIALTFDGYTTTLYVNAVSTATVTGVYGSTAAHALTLGKDGSGLNALSAGVGLGRLAFYPQALSSARVTAHYQAGTIHPMGALAEAKFDTRTALATDARDTFRVVIRLFAQARDTFRVINALHAQARVHFVERAGMTTRAAARFPTRHPQALRAVHTFQTRVRLRGLVLRAAFKVAWPHPELTATFAVTPQLRATFAEVG